MALHTFRQLALRNDFVYGTGESSKFLGLRRHIHIDDPAQLVMVHLSGRFDGRNVRYRIQLGGLLIGGRPDGNLLQVVERVDLGLRVLHRQQVVIPAFWIHPVAGRDHLVGG